MLIDLTYSFEWKISLRATKPMIYLTHFLPLVSFHTPRKFQKTKDSMVSLGVMS